jgi:hypothetical protein
VKRRKEPELRLVAARLELDVEFLQECVRHGAVPAEDLRRDIPPARSARVRRLQRICRGLDLDVYAGSIIVELLEQLDALRRDLDRLRPDAR